MYTEKERRCPDFDKEPKTQSIIDFLSLSSRYFGSVRRQSFFADEITEERAAVGVYIHHR